MPARGDLGAAAARAPRARPGPAAGLRRAPGRRLASSHAIECAVITALDCIPGAGRGIEDMVSATTRAENEFVGAPTGIMDQSASLRAVPGHAGLLDCRDQVVRLVPFDVAAAGLAVLVIDTRVPMPGAATPHGVHPANSLPRSSE